MLQNEGNKRDDDGGLVKCHRSGQLPMDRFPPPGDQDIGCLACTK